MSKAVVLGGGFAGALVAMVLAEHGEQVTLVESASYPADPQPRSGLPQAYHSHVLVTGGERALEALLPGTLDALLDRGAQRRGLPDGALILTSDGWFRGHRTGSSLVSCSRWLLDHVVRGRALAAGAVSVRERTVAQRLVGDASRVRAVVVRNSDGTVETIEADLVVDATGRRSRAIQWLAELGGPAVTEETVDSGLAYSTRIYRAPASMAAAIPAVMIHPLAVPGQPDRGATLYPIEGGGWIVTLTGTTGGEPPVDDTGFDDFARSLRHPLVAELMAAAEPLGPARPYRNTANRRRYFERVSLPDGFLVLGDALVAVNPIYSHGMSVAALSALRLREELSGRELGGRAADPDLLTGLQAGMAAVADTSWQMATAQDRRLAGRSAELREPTPFERRTQARSARQRLNSQVLMTEFFRLQTLNPLPAASGAALFHELANGSEQLLTDDEAIGQHPALAEWLAARHCLAG